MVCVIFLVGLGEVTCRFSFFPNLSPGEECPDLLPRYHQSHQFALHLTKWTQHHPALQQEMLQVHPNDHRRVQEHSRQL